ncbi:splicing factor Prp18 family protein [Actinidia rufa]|uniref:Splicing factor Prp18 family protein n=1 Tax=Actinidia rufa TaxID=165716 RepID=A0A7J0G1T5_9ERIC|nr:splicing factor Prp18 family protein [Actinidia rufa]
MKSNRSESKGFVRKKRAKQNPKLNNSNIQITNSTIRLQIRHQTLTPIPKSPSRRQIPPLLRPPKPEPDEQKIDNLNLPKQDVIRRLRLLKQPVTLFDHDKDLKRMKANFEGLCDEDKILVFFKRLLNEWKHELDERRGEEDSEGEVHCSDV